MPSFRSSPLLSVSLFTTILQLSVTTTAQQVGTTVPEVHPLLPTELCTASDGCTARQTLLVADALNGARPFHSLVDPSVSCSASEALNDTSLCPDAATCARNCALEGIDYGSIGVATRGNAVTLRQYLFNGEVYESVSPRVYLLAEDGENYEGLKLLNQELTFDVDVSRLGCGMNGALYLSEMGLDGGRSETNPAGARYGTGYCDAQCFTNVPWINGLPNLNASGACCNEMDIWEANSQANVFTPHTCSGIGSFLCSGDECVRTEAGSGVCDKDGCGINTFALGTPNFYGPGLTVDSSRPFTIVTQFLTNDNTSTGTLSEIRRLYIQDGNIIPNTAETTNDAVRNIPNGFEGAVTEDYCTARDASDFLRLGGMGGMGESLARGMVLVMSIWNSPGDFMSWLDGGDNGPCNATAGDPQRIVELTPDVSVTFSNIRWGDIGSTFNASSGGDSENVVAGKAVAAESGAGIAQGTPIGLMTGTVVGLAVLLGAFLS
ncbi:putative endo-beta-1,4-glucanase celB [Madurella mycetomatis]|uniref:Glucanase n=1 Tax=Madurella mycetomatis TaxID=100816 RepID=A0A175WGP1_9PEZI|nr:putative endo-beta-1,4-glucanase celB [Madurella mycetomatis]